MRRLEDLDETDRMALEAALEAARSESPERYEQIDEMHKTRDRREVLEFCSYVAQINALHLKPWQSPPCHGNIDGNEECDRLLRQMLDLGTSGYHPDPLAAIKRAEKRKP